MRRIDNDRNRVVLIDSVSFQNLFGRGLLMSRISNHARAYRFDGALSTIL